MTSPESNVAPLVFISYSHDSEEHRAWVLSFAKQLLQRGVDVILDRWDLRAGQLVPAFMARSIESANRVLVICTSRYATKVNQAQGGAGYEGMVIDSAIAQDIDTTKFVPVLRSGGERALPTFLRGRLYISFEDDAKYDESLSALVREIYGVPSDAKPALGRSPFDPAPEEEQHDPTTEIPPERADRWQDDENLFRDARQSLSARKIETFSSKADVRATLGLRAFKGDGKTRQDLRLFYLDQVLTVLSGSVGRREAVEIWLAGVDQYNRSLGLKVSKSAALRHIQEIRLLYGLLATAASGVRDFEVRVQIERWLDITRHNMESTVRHSTA